MSAVVYKGALPPETFSFRVNGLGIPAVSAAIIRVRITGSPTVDWAVDVIEQDATGVTLKHVLQSGETNTTGSYNAMAIMTVTGGTLRSEPRPFTIEDPLP